MVERLKLRDCVPASEIENYVNNWHKKMGDFCNVKKIGESGGYPIMLAEMTNPKISNDNKEIVLIIAQHSVEMSGPNTVFSVGNFLSTKNKEAMDIMNHLRVILIPCANMYSYAKMDPTYQFKNSANVDEYSNAFDKQLNVDKEKTPATYAIKSVIDEYMPELIIDVHGMWWKNAGCVEVTGSYSYANLNYCYDRSFADAMNKACEKKGYAIFSEDAMQNIRPIDPICKESQNIWKFRQGRAGMNACIYAYIKYHTMAINMEVGWEESGVLRIIKALKLGIKPLCNVKGSGYPVRVIRAPMCSSSLLCGGKNAEERRKSRVELWNQTNLFGHGICAMEIHGLQGVMVSLCNDTAKSVIGSGGIYPLTNVIEKLENYGLNLKNVKELYSNVLDQCTMECTWQNSGERVKITNGVTVRVGVPLNDAKVETVLLNGRKLNKNEYSILRKNNFTFIDVLVNKIDCDFIFVNVEYSFKERKYGVIEY